MSEMGTQNSGLTTSQRQAMERASRAALEYRQNLPNRPARPALSLDAAVERFSQPLAEDGMSDDEVIVQMLEAAEGGIHQMTAPSFFGYVCGGSHPVGVAADFLVSAWGQNAASAFESPAITGMERQVCNWLIELMGLPQESGVGLVTGASLANTAGVMSARNALLMRQGWNVEEQGLFGAPEIPVLVGQDAHSAPLAALRYAGFGTERAQRIATDDQGRIDPQAFSQALDDCLAPPLVILQAGQINSGAFDPFAQLILLVHERGGWVHVDGAFGLWLAAVPALADRLAGVQQADSWAVDLHKWLNAPYDCGAVVVRERRWLVASMSARGAYLPDVTAHWEPSDSTPELSRRARGVASYAIMRQLGRKGLREMIARHCHLAERAALRLGEHPGFEVLNDIHSNQVVVACVEGDALTMKVLEQVQAGAKVYPSHGEWAGRKVIRISISNYAMHDEHIDLLCNELEAALAACQG